MGSGGGEPEICADKIFSQWTVELLRLGAPEHNLKSGVGREEEREQVRRDNFVLPTSQREERKFLAWPKRRYELVVCLRMK